MRICLLESVAVIKYATVADPVQCTPWIPHSVDSSIAEINEVQSKRRSTVSESDNENEESPIDIDNIIQAHKEILIHRNELTRSCASGAFSVCNTSRQNFASTGSMKSRGNRARRVARPQTKAQFWIQTLELLPRGFFSDAEALLKQTSKVTQGVPAYHGVAITERNSSDMSHMYEISFLTKHLLGQPKGSYEQFKSTVGQFARMCICLKVVNRYTLYEKGKLFEAVANMKAVQAFISYFQVRSTNGTVCGKSRHLRRLSLHSEMYFSGKNEEMKGRAAQISEYLRNTASCNKTAARMEARKRKNIDERIEKMIMLMPEDFSRFIKEALRELQAIMRSCQRWHTSEKPSFIYSRLIEKSDLVRKWCLNMLAACVLTSGGQRPQVFGQLQTPSSVELKEMEIDAKTRGFFELHTVMEKTVRSADMPNVIFPSVMYNYVKFHVVVIRPAILQKFGLLSAKTAELRNQSLLLDTRNGYSVESRSITSSVRRFLCERDPELSKVTAMSLRASYATMMMDSYQRRAVFRNYTEEEFLTFLSKAMNTSVEQLRSTYVGTSNRDYVDTAKELTSILRIDEERRTTQHVQEEDDSCCDDHFMSLWVPLNENRQR